MNDHRVGIEAELLRILHSPARQYEEVEAEREGRKLFRVTRADRYALQRILNPRLEEAIQARIRGARRSKESWNDYHSARPTQSPMEPGENDSPLANTRDVFQRIKGASHEESAQTTELWVSSEEL